MTDEEPKGKGDKDIKLSVNEWEEIARAMQWPEDLKKWDRVRKPTNLTELAFDGGVKP